MMRTPIIAGNWKMNTTLSDAVDLANGVSAQLPFVTGVTAVVCPPFVSLQAVADALITSDIKVGAQNVHFQPSGAFTGEVSAPMVQGLVSYVIVGHSERRLLFHEMDADVAKKAIVVAAHEMQPILCVGERLETRKAGEAEDTIRTQVRASLDGFEAWDKLVVAYEPVWAIGTGEAASPIVAQEIISVVRSELASLAGQNNADNIPILYGGSVTSENIGPFLDRPDIDGALVGGASLKADEFSRIIQVTASIAAS